MYSTKETSKSERITFRLTADNREVLQADAADLGMSISELIEARLFDAADTSHEAAYNEQDRLDEILDLLKQWQTYAKSVATERNEAQQTVKALHAKATDFERQTNLIRAEKDSLTKKIAAYEGILQPLYAQSQQTGLYDTKGKRIEIQSSAQLLQYIIRNLQIKS